MIPTIGVMIGFYIITRMISLYTRKGDYAESKITKVFTIITIIVAVIGIISLLSGSSDVSRGLNIP